MGRTILWQSFRHLLVSMLHTTRPSEEIWPHIFNCESTLAFSSFDAVTTEKAPTRSPYSPIFCRRYPKSISPGSRGVTPMRNVLTFAKDCAKTMGIPCSTKYRGAKASPSTDPVENPYDGATARSSQCDERQGGRRGGLTW